MSHRSIFSVYEGHLTAPGGSDLASGPPVEYPCLRRKKKSVGSVSAADNGKRKNIIVVTGNIATFQEADVLVNPISRTTGDLKSAGFVSKALYEWGKDELQKNYEEAGPPKQFGVDVSITEPAGLIRARKIFHAAIRGYRNKESLELLTGMIKECLTKAESLEMTSIAFPTVGCGKLRYSADDVAKCFLEAAKETQLKIYVVAYTPELYDTFAKTFYTKEELSICQQEDRPTPPANPTASPAKLIVDDGFVEMPICHPSIAKLTPEFIEKIQDLQTKEVQIHFELDQSTVTLKGSRKLSLEVKQRILELLAEDEMLQEDLDLIKRRKGVIPYLIALSQKKHLGFPDYWQNITCSDLSKSKCDYCEVVESSPAFEAVEALILHTWDSSSVGLGVDARGLTHSGIFIKKISRIENPLLYANYQFKLKALAHKAAHKPFSTVSDFLGENEIKTTQIAGAEYLNSRLINEVNEVYLFHGTSSVHEIAKTGIDYRMAGDQVLFGRGAYFAESSTKADQYADRRRVCKDERLFMFVARVLLGEPFIAREARPDLKKAPCLTLGFRNKEFPKDHLWCDSVIGTHRNDDTRLLFREFIVYHPDQCYPEFLVEYVRE